MIELFDNRLVITNPGGLVSAISLEDFGTISSSRNPLIFGLFERANMVEQVGSGINRIKGAMKSAGLQKPIFKTEGMFSIIFYRPIEEGSQKSSQKILILISNNKNITTTEIADELNISRRAVAKQVALLKTAGKLKRIGPDKGGYWEVVI